MGSAPNPTAGDSVVRVLIADDDPWIRESVGFLLRDAGYEVLETEDGQETLNTLLYHPHPLVVLLDLLMPTMTGFEVLRRVGKDEILRQRHAYIVCSAQPYTPERVGQHFVDLLQQLNIPYVARPFDIEVLLTTIKAAAERICPGGDASSHADSA